MASVDLHCGSCSNYFSDPRLLPCLHVFCKSCLDSIKSMNEGTLTCPSCYKATPTQDISTLPRHLKIEREVNILKLQESSNEAVCGSCEKNNKAEAYCIDCDLPICSSCVNAHETMKTLKNHSITSLDSAKPQTITVTCNDHPTEIVKYYCSQCSCLICNECIIEHKEHNLMPIDEAAKSEISKLASFLPKFEQCMKPVGEAIESVTATIEAITNKQEVLVANVEEAFQMIISSVEKRRGEVVGEINSLFIAQQTRLQIQKEELENSLGGLKLALDTTTMACNDYSTPEVLAVSRLAQSAAESSLKNVKSFPNVFDDSCPEFIYDLCQVDKVISSFGKLSFFSTCPSLCSLVDVNPNASIGVGCGIKSCLILQTRNSKGDDLKVGGADVKATIQRLNFLLDCKVEDCGDGRYNIIFTVNSPGLFKLHVVVDGEDICNSPYSVNSINYKDIKKSGFQVQTKQTSSYAPQYAAWGEVTGSLYISTNEGYVLVYNKEMNLKKVISRDMFGRNKLRGILVDEKEGTMLLADSDSCLIIKADLDGNVIMSVGGFGGDQPLKFRYTTGLAKTKEGLILVGDCQHNQVQILNPDLSHHSDIQCHGQVWGVSVDRNNLIHVGTTRCVEVFKFERNEYSRIVEYTSVITKVGGIHFPNYQHADSTYSLVTFCYDDGKVILYNWMEDENIASFSIGNKPLGIAINQDGVVCVCCYGDREFHLFGHYL